MTSVSKRDRQFDLGALALVVTGAVLCVNAAIRLHTISLYSRTNPGPRGALFAADQARYTGYAGVAVIVLGCAVAIAAAVRHTLARRTMAASAIVPAGD
jgi:hypothetical protein